MSGKILTVKILESKWYKNVNFYFTLIAIVISITSLLISIGVQNRFEPYAKIGGLYLFPPEENDREFLVFLLPITFVNNGDKSGIIENIYCEVKIGNKSLKYEPQFKVNYESFDVNEAISLGEMQNVFMPFGLNNRQSQLEFYFFTPNMVGRGTKYLRLLPGTYKISLYCKADGEAEHTLLDSKDFFIDESLVNRYKKGNNTIISRDWTVFGLNTEHSKP